MERLDLRGRAVLITGAAGGIGSATARALVSRGVRVALMDLAGQRLDDLAAELGPAAVTAPADVRDRDAVFGAVERAADRLDGLTAAVVGAGIVRPETLVGQTEDDARHVVDVNLYGTLWSLQALVPHIDRAGGHLLALSSVAGIAPIPLSGVYPATKAAIDNMIAQVRTELMHSRGSAGTVYLSFVDTPMARDVRDDPRTGRAIGKTFKFLTKASTAEDVAERVVSGLQRRARTITEPRWQAPAAWPQTLVHATADAVMRRTPLKDEVPAAGRTIAAPPASLPSVAEGATRRRTDVGGDAAPDRTTAPQTAPGGAA